MKRRPVLRVRAAAAGGMVIALASAAASLVLSVAIVRHDGSAAFDTQTLGSLTLGAGYAVIGWLVASRRSDNPIGWVFLAIGLSQEVEVFATLGSIYGFTTVPGSLPMADVLSWVVVWAWVPGFSLLVTFSLLLFPDGHLPSPRWRPVAWLSVVTMALLGIPVAIATWPLRGVTLTGSLDGLDGAMGAVRVIQFLGILLSLAVALASVASMVARFRRSTGQERQQLKWFTYAAISTVGFVMATGFLTIPPAIGLLAAVFIAPLLPFAIGIAVLRYRLYEIDRIVSRTIAYAVVTGFLAATFGATILLLQAVLAPFTQSQTIAVAASTLAVFALFQPVLRRVRRAVDRRFDRARYDAEGTAAAFSERLRDEMDLATVTTDLARTTESALAPSNLGIWIRRPSTAETPRTVTIPGHSQPTMTST